MKTMILRVGVLVGLLNLFAAIAATFGWDGRGRTNLLTIVYLFSVLPAVLMSGKYPRGAAVWLCVGGIALVATWMGVRHISSDGPSTIDLAITFLPATFVGMLLLASASKQHRRGNSNEAD